MDCTSEKSHEMNSIYAHPADEYFQSTKTNVSDDIFSYFLRNKKIMTISNDLFLNYYSPELSEKISVIFNNICGNNSNNNMMVAEINENSNNIESLPGIICIDSDKNAQIQALIFNPKYSLQKNEFWQALSSESEVALKRMGLRLRLSNKLSLP